MVPDQIPRVGEDVPERVVIRLAGEHVPVRFDAHAVQRGCAAFHAEVICGRVEFAVLRGRIPDEPLAALVSFSRGDIQYWLQFAFLEPGPHRQPAAGMDQGIQADGRDANIRQKIQCVRDGVDVRSEHGGVGHHVQIAC